MNNLTDSKLLSRATHAGRNLSVLAMLATAGAAALIAISLFVKGTHSFTAVLAAAITLIAAGYWFLAVAAKRGNPNAVGVVIVLLGVQIALSFISSGIVAARTNTAFEPNLAGLLIPILVLVALQSSRKVLLELRVRGLWDQVFGTAKSSRNLCLIGGTLLAVGFLSMNGGMIYVGHQIGQKLTAESQDAQAFVRMIKEDEQAFLVAMRGLSGGFGPSEIDVALTKLNALEQQLVAIKNDTANAARLGPILSTYSTAVRQWKNALLLLKEPKPDTDRALKMLQLGDQLRAQAFQAFDRQYASRKSPQGS